jgi:hypothetical protein
MQQQGGMRSPSPEISASINGNVDRWFTLGLLIPAAMVPLNLALGLLRFLDYSDDSALFAVLHYFDMGEELTFPTWFSTALLVTAALVSLAAAQRVQSPVARRGFRILTWAMFYLSLDEATELHERTTDPLRNGLDLGGLLYWSWVIPAGLAVLLVGVLLWRFLTTLPSHAQSPLMLSGALYVFCALVLELVEGYFFDQGGASAATDILSLIEEVGEMVAVMLYIRTVVVIASSGIDGLIDNRFPRVRAALNRHSA